IAYDNKGNLFVASWSDDTLVQVGPQTGAVLQTIPLHSNGHPDGVTFDPVTGAFWVADESGGLVEVSNYLTAPQVHEFVSSLPLAGQIFDGVESDGLGNIYIAEYNGTNPGRTDQYNIASNTFKALTSVSIDDVAPVVGLGSLAGSVALAPTVV